VAAYFPSGGKLAFTDSDRTIRILDLQADAVLERTFMASERVGGLAVDHREQLLIAGGTGLPQAWSLEPGRESPPLPEVSLAFRPAPLRLGTSEIILAGNESGLFIHDLARNQVVHRPPGKRYLPGSAAVEPDGARASVAFPRSHVVYDLDSAQALCEPVAHREAQQRPARFSGSQFATLGDDTSLVIWQLGDNRLQPLALPHGSPVHSAGFSPDGRRAVTAATDGRAILWDTASGRSNLVMTHGARVWTAGFSPDGKRLATASWDATARLWDAQTGQPLCEPLRARSYVFHVEFSPDGRQLLACGEDGVVRVYDGERGELRHELVHNKPVYWARFSPDGQVIVSRPLWSAPRLWRAEDGMLIRELEETAAAEGAAAVVVRGDFSRDGRWLALGSQARCATIWRLPDGQRQATLPHAAVVRNAVFSPDARRLLTAADDLTARFWEVPDGRATSPVMASPQSLDMEANSGNSLRVAAIHPDGRRAITGGSDGALTLWDTEHGFALCEGLEAGGSILHAEFSPDCKRLLATSFDGSARVWSPPPILDQAPPWLAPLAEALAGRSETEAAAPQRSSPALLWEICEQLRRAPESDAPARWARDVLGL
jgi:WD40 repeat protein